MTTTKQNEMWTLNCAHRYWKQPLFCDLIVKKWMVRLEDSKLSLCQIKARGLETFEKYSFMEIINSLDWHRHELRLWIWIVYLHTEQIRGLTMACLRFPHFKVNLKSLQPLIYQPCICCLYPQAVFWSGFVLSPILYEVMSGGLVEVPV